MPQPLLGSPPGLLSTFVAMVKSEAGSREPEPAEAGPTLQAQLELEQADQPAPAATPPLFPSLLPLAECKHGNLVSWSSSRPERCPRPSGTGGWGMGGAEGSAGFPLFLVVPLHPTCSQCELSSSPCNFRCSHSPMPLTTSLPGLPHPHSLVSGRLPSPLIFSPHCPHNLLSHCTPCPDHTRVLLPLRDSIIIFF